MHPLLYKILCLLVLTFHCNYSTCHSILRRGLPELVTAHGEVDFCIGIDSKGSITDGNAVIPLRDLRQSDSNEPPDLKTQGFTYVLRDIPPEASQFPLYSKEYTEVLERDAIDLVEELTKSQSIFCWAHLYRGSEMKPPTTKIIRSLHSDMSTGGAKFLMSNFMPTREGIDDKKTNGFHKKMLDPDKRVVIFNVWRPLQQVERDPLAICDWQTTSDQDVKQFDRPVTIARQLIQGWDYNEHQRWYYLSQQKPNEVFVFVQHDSAAPDGHGMSVPHVSPRLLNTPDDAAPRISCEFKVAAIVGPEFKLDNERKSRNKSKGEGESEGGSKSESESENKSESGSESKIESS
ncbi:hypothetical protein DFH28DRAFT_1057999 [Melampsora americana]|nr:hypothetical protein DFH28DRAFT_1057999 [Melampsora americana]